MLLLLMLSVLSIVAITLMFSLFFVVAGVALVALVASVTVITGAVYSGNSRWCTGVPQAKAKKSHRPTCLVPCTLYLSVR